MSGDQARVSGVEIGYQQQLSFLPGALNGLGLLANYKYSKSETDAGSPHRENPPSPQAIPHCGKLAVSSTRRASRGWSR